jgi:hypothetical protein
LHQIKSHALKNSNIQKSASVKEKKASANDDENADLGKYKNAQDWHPNRVRRFID